MNKGYISCIMLGIMVLLFFVVSLLIGSVSIPVSETFRILIGEESVKPSWQYIVIESRLPQAVTAMLCGASLAVCGLILQTAFRNPLAGPSIFGVNSGAGLGVALVMLFFGWNCQHWRFHGCSSCCICRSYGCHGVDLFLFHIGAKSCDVADCWHNDRLYGWFCHFLAQFFCNR